MRPISPTFCYWEYTHILVCICTQIHMGAYRQCLPVMQDWDLQLQNDISQRLLDYTELGSGHIIRESTFLSKTRSFYESSCQRTSSFTRIMTNHKREYYHFTNGLLPVTSTEELSSPPPSPINTAELLAEGQQITNLQTFRPTV